MRTRRLIEDDRLAFKEGPKTFFAAFATDAGLLEPTEGHSELGLEAVVAHGAGSDLAGGFAGAIPSGVNTDALSP